VERALVIAREAHEGQKRRHGAPYIGHPVAVRHLVDDLALACGIEIDDVTRATALLHDVLEDSEIEKDELAARFGDDVANRVDWLTKRGKGPEATTAYYARLDKHADDALRLVKVCDRVHNLSELHLAPDPAKLEKYVAETLEHVIPMAAAGARGAGLVAALHDGIRAACRAQGESAPAESKLPPSSVPLGLYAIVGPKDGDDIVARVDALLAGGASFVQLRAKGKTDREILALLETLKPRCRRAGVPLVVNDRPDLCVAAGVDGVHVGQTDIPPLLARGIVGKTALVGASSHTEPELVDACAEGGADHVAVGPVYLSPTKQGHAPVVGLEALARRCRIARLPVVAIGGITTPQCVAECARAGASLVAAVSALEGADARVMARRMSASFFAARASSSSTVFPKEPS
jgi:thiamine-phosphate pyrophosphorylase